MSYIEGSNALSDWVYIKGTSNKPGSVRVRVLDEVFQAEILVNGLWCREYDSSTGSQSSTGEVSSTPYTVSGTDSVLLVDATAEDIEVNLPAASDVEDISYTVKKVNSTGSDVVINGYDDETIDGDSTVTLVGSDRPSITIISDGTEWHII